MRKDIKNKSFFIKLIIFFVLFFSVLNFKGLTGFADETKEQEGSIEDVLQYIQKDGKIIFDESGEPEKAGKIEKFSSPKQVSSKSALEIFDWNNWQKDPDIGFNWWADSVTSGLGGYKQRKFVHNEFKLKSKGDTVARLEDYGRAASAPKAEFSKFDTNTKITVFDYKLWDNLPGSPWVGKDYEWSSKMQQNIRNDYYSENNDAFGGYFNVPTKDGEKKAPRNDWIVDDETSATDADVTVQPITFDFYSIENSAHNKMEFRFTMTPYTGERWMGSRKILVPQIVKTEYRNIATGEKIAEPDNYGMTQIYNSSVEAKAKNISGYKFDHYEYADNKKVTKNGVVGDTTWKGNMTTTKKGIVFWYQQDKANAVVSKKVSKAEVPMEVYTEPNKTETNDHRKVDYSVKVANSKVNETVATLDDFTLVDELPEGVSLVEPFKIEHIVSTTSRAEVPEKSKANGKKPYYELSKKTDTNGKTRQIITIFGSRINVGQYDEFYYTALVDEGKHDEVKTNTATVTAPNTEKATGTASFKISNKAKMSTIKSVKNLTNTETEYAKSTVGKKNDKLQYQVQVANSRYGTPASTGVLNEANIVDKIPTGLTPPTNVQELTSGGKKNIPEKSKVTALDKVYYEWNSTSRELTVVEKTRLKIGKAHVIYYDTTIETYDETKVNIVKATSPGVDSSEGKATVNMFADSNPQISKWAFKWQDDGTRGQEIKEIGVGDSFTYGIFISNAATSATNPGTDKMHKIVVKDFLPDGLETPTNVLLDSNKKDNPAVAFPLKTSENQTGRYYEFNEKTRELTINFGTGSVISPNGSGWSITFDTKSVSYKAGDTITNKAEVHSDSEKVPKTTHDLKVGKEVKVTFHTGDDVIKRTKPDPNPQYPGYGNKAKVPSQEPIGYEYHADYKKMNETNYDQNDPSQGKDDRKQDIRMANKAFVGWYIDKEFTKEYDFNTPVTQDVDLYAKWRLNPGAGMFKKAFDRNTLETENDTGPYKAPGKQLTDIRVGDTFSYMAIARNTDIERENMVREELDDVLPAEVSLPKKVELFTVDGKKETDDNYQTAVPGTMKIHEVLEKSKVASPDKDEYYEILTEASGTRIIHFRNLKEKEIKGINFAGFIIDSKLEKRPVINDQKNYEFTNRAEFDFGNTKVYTPYTNGTLGGGTFKVVANATVHVPWKVEFEPNGGKPKPDDQLVRNEKLAKEPSGDQVPKKDSQVFGGWYEDKELTKKFDFKTPITKDRILYAKWDELPPELQLDKTANKKMVEAGETVSYTITMKNKSKSTLKDAKLGDIIPEGMSKPDKIKLDGLSISEGKANANGDGAYYTWSPTEQMLTVYYNELLGNAEKKLTYDSKVTSGKSEETKKNSATFVGSNSHNGATANYTVTVVGPKATIHVKQEVLGKHGEIVVPKTGYLTLDHVNSNDVSDKKNQVSMVIPSYEGDTDQAYKDVKLKLNYGYTGYLPKEVVPEFYVYDGYQLTSDNGNHRSANKKAGEMPVVNLAEKQEYWLTVYIKPKISEDGPPFYNWDYKTNDFGIVKNFFDWKNWQKDPVFDFYYGQGPDYQGIYTKYWIKEEGDTIAQLQDFGREIGALHGRVSGGPAEMEFPDRDPWVKWDQEMGVVVKNSKLWQNIPKKATVDPATKDAKWDGKMATKSMNSSNYYIIGGYFLDTTPDPAELPPQNYWIVDDTEPNFSPLFAKADPIIFDYVNTNVAAEVYTTMNYEANQKIGKTYQMGNRNIYTPQMVKAQFRDIDTNQQISEEKIVGKKGKYKDPVSISAENKQGYTFDHYEYVDSKDNKKIGNKGDATWKGELTTTKKGIVFWYKK